MGPSVASQLPGQLGEAPRALTPRGFRWANLCSQVVEAFLTSDLGGRIFSSDVAGFHRADGPA
jgi:hypothetical protein